MKTHTFKHPAGHTETHAEVSGEELLNGLMKSLSMLHAGDMEGFSKEDMVIASYGSALISCGAPMDIVSQIASQASDKVNKSPKSCSFCNSPLS